MEYGAFIQLSDYVLFSFGLKGVSYRGQCSLRPPLTYLWKCSLQVQELKCALSATIMIHRVCCQASNPMWENGNHTLTQKEDRAELLYSQVSPNSSSVVASPTTTLLQQQKPVEAPQQLNATHTTYEQHVSNTELPPEQGRRGPKWGSRPTPATEVRRLFWILLIQAVSFKTSYF